MALTDKQARFLKAEGHHLKPVVTVGGNGLTENVVSEIDNSLNHHELMKVKMAVGDREERDAAIEEMCDKVDADFVARVGNMVILFRQDPRESKFKLPKA